MEIEKKNRKNILNAFNMILEDFIQRLMIILGSLRKYILLALNEINSSFSGHVNYSQNFVDTINRIIHG